MIAYLILFIKVLKSLGQILGAKNVVAHFLSNFLPFLYFLENDRVSYILFVKVLKSLRQIFTKNVVEV
jgi:hypothetical protein